MEKMSFEHALEMIVAEDSRYDEQAYLFTREALDYTIRKLSKPSEGPARHVSGRELLDGVRQYALSEFGPLTRTVLNKWGLKETNDFGNVVFNLVTKGVLGKTDEDRLEDFDDSYTFEEAFWKPFLPEKPKPARRKSTKKKQPASE